MIDQTKPLTREQMEKLWPLLLGVPLREADFQVLQFLPGGRTISNVAEYIWDHWMGEPENVAQHQVEGAIIDLLNGKNPEDIVL